MGKIGDVFSKAMGSGDEEPDAMDPTEESEGEYEGGDEKAELLATKQLLKAVRGGDAGAVRSALKSFLTACGVA